MPRLLPNASIFQTVWTIVFISLLASERGMLHLMTTPVHGGLWYTGNRGLSGTWSGETKYVGSAYSDGDAASDVYGTRHVAYLTTVTGRGYMWGENPSLVELWGRTGDQSPRVFIPLNINVGVLESKRIKTLLGGVYFSCALTIDGIVACWGQNDEGQCGRSSPGVVSTPTQIAFPDSKFPVRIALGDSNGFAVMSDGTMYGWGKDYLLPTKSYTPVPIMLGGDALVSKIWSRGRLAVATTVTGRIFAWGVSSLLNETVPAEITYSAEVTIGSVAKVDFSYDKILLSTHTRDLYMLGADFLGTAPTKKELPEFMMGVRPKCDDFTGYYRHGGEDMFFCQPSIDGIRFGSAAMTESLTKSLFLRLAGPPSPDFQTSDIFKVDYGDGSFGTKFFARYAITDYVVVGVDPYGFLYTYYMGDTMTAVASYSEHEGENSIYGMSSPGTDRIKAISASADSVIIANDKYPHTTIQFWSSFPEGSPIQAFECFGFPPQTYTHVAAGGSWGLALAKDGTIWGCGNNPIKHLPLGTGGIPDLINPFLVQVQFSSPFNEAKFAAIAASGAAAYGLTISGALYGWGANSGAVAGFINETLLPSDYLPPRLLGEFPPGSKLFTSTERSTEEVPRGRLFVVSADGSTMSVAGISDCRSFLPLTVPCSSDSLHVQALVPLPRTGLPVDASIVKVAGGSAFTVVLMSNGAIYAIGDSSSGQMGNGFFTSATEWQRVKITSPCRDIAAANAAVQAVCDGFSEPYMWGSSEYGLILQSGLVATPKVVHIVPNVEYTLISCGMNTCFGVTRACIKRFFAVAHDVIADFNMSDAYINPGSMRNPTPLTHTLIFECTICGLMRYFGPSPSVELAWTTDPDVDRSTLTWQVAEWADLDDLANSQFIVLLGGSFPPTGTIYVALRLGPFGSLADPTEQTPFEPFTVVPYPSIGGGEPIEVSSTATVLTFPGNNLLASEWAGETNLYKIVIFPDFECKVESFTDTSISCAVSAPALIVGPLRARLESQVQSLPTDFVDFGTISEPVLISQTETAYLATTIAMTVRGANFGNVSSDLNIVIEHAVKSPCSVTSIPDDGMVVCQLSSPIYDSYMGALRAYVTRGTSKTVEGIIGVAALTPMPSPNNDARHASNKVTLTLAGFNFGVDKNRVLVSLRSGTNDNSTSVCNVTAALSTTIVCTISDGALQSGEDLYVAVGLGFESTYFVKIGSIISPPAVAPAPAYNRARSATELVISGSGFDTSNGGANVKVTLSSGFCNVTSVTETEIRCSIITSLRKRALAIGPLTATVTSYGGDSFSIVVANIVADPVILPSTQEIAYETTSLGIHGEGFDDVAQNNAINLYVNSVFFGQAVAVEGNSTYLRIITAPLNVTGTLTASVVAFGANVAPVTIGVVQSPPDLALAGTPLQPGQIAGIVVGVILGFLLIAAVAILFIRRRLQYLSDIKSLEMVELPDEMKHVFNIKSSDLEIIHKIGEGSYGAVYLGRFHRQYVAIKRLTGGMISANVNEFFREASLMLGMKPHNNIVRVLGMCQETNNFSLVMEFLSGGSLVDYVATNLGSIPDVIMFRIAIGMARGLADLAKQNIVHRDLAARNILLDASMEPKISDFGFSRMVAGGSAEGQTECLRNRTYSEKTDVWAYGCVLLEMLTGKEPYSGQDTVTVAVKIRDEGLTPKGEIPEEAPAYLRDLMNVCWTVSTKARPKFADIITFLENNAPKKVLEAYEEQKSIASPISNYIDANERPSKPRREFSRPGNTAYTSLNV